MWKLPTHQRKKGPCTGGGQTLFFIVTGGKQRDWVGNCPLVYMLQEVMLPVISIPFIQKPQCVKRMVLNRNISLNTLQNRNTKVSTAISWCWSLATKFSWCCQTISIYATKLTSFACNSGLDGPVFLLEPCIPGGISTSRFCFGALCFRLLRLLP